jgi:hypothetical protein
VDDLVVLTADVDDDDRAAVGQMSGWVIACLTVAEVLAGPGLSKIIRPGRRPGAGEGVVRGAEAVSEQVIRDLRVTTPSA